MRKDIVQISGNEDGVYALCGNGDIYWACTDMPIDLIKWEKLPGIPVSDPDEWCVKDDPGLGPRVLISKE